MPNVKQIEKIIGTNTAPESMLAQPNTNLNASIPNQPIVTPVEQSVKSFDEDVSKIQAQIQSDLENAQRQKSIEAAAQISNFETQEKDRQAQMKTLSNLTSEYDGLGKKLQEVNKKQIDPNRFWSSMSTWQKVLAGISIALGGLGSKSTGGQNAAWNIINKAIDSDIDAQKENINLDFKNLNQQMALKQLKIQGVKDYLTQASEKVNDDLKRTQMATLINKLEMEQQGLDQRRLINESLKQGSQIDLELLPKEQRERAIRLNDGSILLATKSANTKPITEQISNAQKVSGYVAGLENTLNEAETGGYSALRQLWDRELAKDLARNAAFLVGSLRLSVVGGGQFSDQERKFLEKAVGNPESLVQDVDATRKNLKLLREGVKESVRSSMRLNSTNAEKFVNPNESNVQTLMKSGKVRSRVDALDILKAAGKYKEDPLDSAIGF